MNKQHQVPFHQFRAGAIIEFEVSPGRPCQGTVQALRVYGARNFLAVLSRCVEFDGTVREGLNEHTQCPIAINLTHASRVIQHSSNSVVFDKEDHVSTMLLKELAEHRTLGHMSRRGKRVVIDGAKIYAEGVVRDMTWAHIVSRQDMLGVRPWEVVDYAALVETATRQGIIRKFMHPEHEHFAQRIEVRTDKLARFVQRSINRFKLDTRAEEKARHQMEDEFDRQDMERDRRLAALHDEEFVGDAVSMA